MSQTTINLGFVPKNREVTDWDNLPAGTKFYKDNIVQFKGSSYICSPVGYNPEHHTDFFVTVKPWTESPQVLNAGWKVFASGNNKFTTGESVDGLGIDQSPQYGSSGLITSKAVAAHGSAFDISEYNKNGNTLATYTTLADALAAVPAAAKRGGMSIKFIQLTPATYSVVKTEGLTEQPTGTEIQEALAIENGTYTAEQLPVEAPSSAVTYWMAVTETVEEVETTTYTSWVITKVTSDATEYVQYRLISTAWSNVVTNWQGIDDEPTAGSENLVKSGGIEKELPTFKLKGADNTLVASSKYSNIKVGNTYRIWVQNPNISMEGVTESGTKDKLGISVYDSQDSRLEYIHVTISDTNPLADYYDVTIPADSAYLVVRMRAAADADQTFILEDVTYTKKIDGGYKFLGIANASSPLPTPTSKAYYIANTPATYSFANGQESITISYRSFTLVYLLIYDNGQWSSSAVNPLSLYLQNYAIGINEVTVIDLTDLLYSGYYVNTSGTKRSDIYYGITKPISLQKGQIICGIVSQRMDSPVALLSKYENEGGVETFTPLVTTDRSSNYWYAATEDMDVVITWYTSGSLARSFKFSSDVLRRVEITKGNSIRINGKTEIFSVGFNSAVENTGVNRSVTLYLAKNHTYQLHVIKHKWTQSTEGITLRLKKYINGQNQLIMNYLTIEIIPDSILITVTDEDYFTLDVLGDDGTRAIFRIEDITDTINNLDSFSINKIIDKRGLINNKNLFINSDNLLVTSLASEIYYIPVKRDEIIAVRLLNNAHRQTSVSTRIGFTTELPAANVEVNVLYSVRDEVIYKTFVAESDGYFIISKKSDIFIQTGDVFEVDKILNDKQGRNLFFFGGMGNTTGYSHFYQGIKGGNTYRAWIKNPDVNIEGLQPSTSGLIITCRNAAQEITRLVEVPLFDQIANYYDFTLPSDAISIRMYGRSAVGEQIVAYLEDITDKVLTTEQTLTDSQKAQVKTNLGIDSTAGGGNGYAQPFPKLVQGAIQADGTINNDTHYVTSDIINNGFYLWLNNSYRIYRVATVDMEGNVVDYYKVQPDTRGNAESTAVYGSLSGWKFRRFYGNCNFNPKYGVRVVICHKADNDNDDSATTTPTATITPSENIIKQFGYVSDGKLIPDVPIESEVYWNCVTRVLKAQMCVWDTAVHRDVSPTNDYMNAGHHNVGQMNIGMPYSSVQSTNKFIFEEVSLHTFMTALRNKRSLWNTEYVRQNNPVSAYGITYNAIDNSTTYYGMVCSQFVAYALGMSSRANTANFHTIPGMSIISSWGNTGDESATIDVSYVVSNVKPLDIFTNSHHTFMCLGVLRDIKGKVKAILIAESVRPTTMIIPYTPDALTNRLNSEWHKHLRWSNAKLVANKDRNMEDSPYVITDFDGYVPEVTYNTEIMTFAGDKAYFLEGDKIYLNAIPGSSYTKIELFKNDNVSAEETIDISSYTPDADGYIDVNLTTLNLTYGKYKARLSNVDGSIVSDCTYFEVINATLSATKDGNTYTFAFGSANGEPITIKRAYLSGFDGYYYRDFNETELASGIAVRTWSINSSCRYAWLYVQGEYGRVVKSLDLYTL